MRYSIDLRTTFQPWVNFVFHVTHHGGSDSCIYHLLKTEYNAEVAPAHITFKSEEDMALFLLRWS